MDDIYFGWKGGFRTAFLKGRQARKDGLRLVDCPYQKDEMIRVSSRTGRRRRPSFSMAWARAWRDGWRAEDRGL